MECNFTKLLLDTVWLNQVAQRGHNYKLSPMFTSQTVTPSLRWSPSQTRCGNSRGISWSWLSMKGQCSLLLSSSSATFTSSSDESAAAVARKKRESWTRRTKDWVSSLNEWYLIFVTRRKWAICKTFLFSESVIVGAIKSMIVLSQWTRPLQSTRPYSFAQYRLIELLINTNLNKLLYIYKWHLFSICIDLWINYLSYKFTFSGIRLIDWSQYLLFSLRAYPEFWGAEVPVWIWGAVCGRVLQRERRWAAVLKWWKDKGDIWKVINSVKHLSRLINCLKVVSSVKLDLTFKLFCHTFEK